VVVLVVAGGGGGSSSSSNSMPQPLPHPLPHPGSHQQPVSSKPIVAKAKAHPMGKARIPHLASSGSGFPAGSRDPEAARRSRQKRIGEKRARWRLASLLLASSSKLESPFELIAAIVA
jgi:hypothetical protein